MALLLFIKQNCPDCSAAKDLLELRSIDVEVIDADSSEGFDQVVKYGVGKVPTLIHVEKSETVDRATGLVDIESLIDEL